MNENSSEKTRVSNVATNLPDPSLVGSEESPVDKLRSQAPEILSGYFKERSVSAENFKILNIDKTSKSIYGAIEIGGEKKFFKLSKAQNIATELSGYRLASEYPHEKIVDHYYNGDVGLYIQDFNKEIDEGNGLLIRETNSLLSSEDPEAMNKILVKTKNIFDAMGEIYNKTLTKTPCILRGPNDAFFHDRLKEGGRVDQIYKNKTIELPSASGSIPFEELAEYQICVNGELTGATIKELFDKAKGELDPNKPRHFVLSQGDLNESNVTKEGIYFDFETAGLNSFVQDAAVFTADTFFGSHYIFSKYSEFEKSVRGEEEEKFAGQVSFRYASDKEKKKIAITINFPLPLIKQKLMQQYKDLVIKKVESGLGDVGQERLVSQFQSALFLRIMGVKNLLKFDEKDLILSLGFVEYFCKDASSLKKISEFIEHKFNSIRS